MEERIGDLRAEEDQGEMRISTWIGGDEGWVTVTQPLFRQDFPAAKEEHRAIHEAIDAKNDLQEARDLLLMAVEILVRRTTIDISADSIGGQYIESVAQFLDRTK